MKKMSRGAILAIAAMIVLYFVYQRLRIVFFVNLSLWQALLLFGIVVFGLFLLLDHLINRER